MDFIVLEKKQFEYLQNELKTIKSALNHLLDSKYEKQLISNDEFCNLLGITKRTAQNYRSAGRISFVQYGRKIWYTQEQVNAFLERYQIS